jgi:hypothetical protein
MEKAISWEEFLYHINKNLKYALIYFIIIVIIIAVVITCSIALPILLMRTTTSNNATPSPSPSPTPSPSPNSTPTPSANTPTTTVPSCSYGKCCKYGISPNSVKCNESVYCENSMRSTSGKCCTNGITQKSGKYCNDPCDVQKGTPQVLSYKGKCCPYGVTVDGSVCFNTLCTTALKLKGRVGDECKCLYGIAPNGECAYKCTRDGNQVNTLLSYSGKCCIYGITTMGRSNGDGDKKYYCNEKCTVDGIQQYNKISPYGDCCTMGIAKNGIDCKRNCGYDYDTTDKYWTNAGKCCSYKVAPGENDCNSSRNCNTTNNKDRTDKGRCCIAGVTIYRYECNAEPCPYDTSKNTSRGKCCPSAQYNDNVDYANVCENPKCGQESAFYNVYTTYADNGNGVQHNVCCDTSVGRNANATGCNQICANVDNLSAGGHCCVSGITSYKNGDYHICNDTCCKTGNNILTKLGGDACKHNDKGFCAKYGFTRQAGIATNRNKATPIRCTNTSQFSANGLCCKSSYIDNKFYKGVAVNTAHCNIPCPNTSKYYNNTTGACVSCPNGVTTGNTPPTQCNKSCGCYNHTAHGNCTDVQIHNKTRKGDCCATGMARCGNGYKCMDTGCEYSGTYDCGKCYPNTSNGYHTKHGDFCGYTYYGDYNHILVSGKGCVEGGIYPSQWG